MSDAADAARYRYLRARMRQKRTHPSHLYVNLPAIDAQRVATLEAPDLSARLDAAIDTQLQEAQWQDSLREST